MLLLNDALLHVAYLLSYANYFQFNNYNNNIIKAKIKINNMSFLISGCLKCIGFVLKPCLKNCFEYINGTVMKR